jgi:glycine/D-amino acid oxidase-like deaminating enzyme
VADLKRELAARHRSGLPGRWVDGQRLQSLAGFGADAGIITPGNAQVDPYRACLAFARAAEKGGAKIFERSHVTRVKGDHDGVRLRIAGGATIAATYVVIATGYATPEFKPLPSRFRMMNTYVIATPRLSSLQRREIGFGDVMLWDTNHPYHYLRWTPDRRLIFGGLDRPRVPRATRPAALRRRTTELMETLASWYPSLERVTAEYAWEGLFATTPDGLPYVGKHRRYPRHLFALGYGGNGMTLGFLASQIVVRLAQDRAKPDDELFSFGRG